MMILIPGYGNVALDELREDVEAAKKFSLLGKRAFTPETVEGLIAKIDELTAKP